jgi:hypothetical protein
MDKEAAMKQAIKYCIEHDILKEFLQTNASEVINMLLTEWNWDDFIAVREAEAHEDGMAEGQEKGREGRDAEILRYINEGHSAEDLKRLLQKDRMPGGNQDHFPET